jgi:WD40 repeat protein
VKRTLLLILTLFLLSSCVETAAPADSRGTTTANTPANESAPPAALPTVALAEEAPDEEIPASINPQNAVHITEIASYPFENPRRLTFSPDGAHVIVSGGKQAARLTLPGLQLDRRIMLRDDEFLLAVSPAGDLIASTGDHETVDIYSLSAGQKVYTLRPQGPFSGVFFVPESTLVGIVNINAIRVDLMDYQTGKAGRQFSGFETAAPVYNAFPGANGKTLVWISRGRIQLMDFKTGQFGAEFAHEDFINGWDLSPDGSLLAASAGGELDGEFSPLLYLWDARTGQPIDALKLPDTLALSVAFSPDGQILAASAGRNILLYRVSDRSLLTTLEGPTDFISFLAFSPDGRSLIASAQDNLVHLWQVVP